MTNRDNIQTRDVISYGTCSLILLLILLFHSFRIRYITKTAFKRKLFKYIQLSHVSFIIIIISTFRCILLTTWHLLPQFLNNKSCQILIIIDASCWFSCQGFIHLFIAMRSRLNSLLPTSSPKRTNIWFNIGLILIIFDFLIMFFILTGNAFDVEYINHTCQPLNISIILIIGTMCSSVIIGCYSLFVFVIPLQKYIKLEQTLKIAPADRFIEKLVIKILIYSTIMTMTTVLSTLIIAMIEDYVVVSALDNIINSYCILLQFRDININDINSTYLQRVVWILQCGCCCCFLNKHETERTLAELITVKTRSHNHLDVPHLTSDKSFTKSNTSLSTKSKSITDFVMHESNYSDDRKKYIETIIQNDVQNNVTGKYLSLSVVETAYIFWKKHISTLNPNTKLEIACLIFFEMRLSTSEMRDTMKQIVESTNNNIETFSLSIMDMLEWLVNHLLVNDIDLYDALQQLGAAHTSMGIQIKYFGAMLTAVHNTFAHYFENKYSIKEKYAIDKIFSVASQIMTGEDLHSVQSLQDFAESFDNLDFIQSLDICLKSQVGMQYLYRFLEQTFCDELVIWLQEMKTFKCAMSDKERFMIARRIKVTCIEPIAPFSINISHETRTQLLLMMKELEKQWHIGVRNEFKVSSQLFDKCNIEIKRLMAKNHWKRFVQNINNFKNSSV